MDVIFNICNKNDFSKVSNDILSHLLDNEKIDTTIVSENDYNAAKKAFINILNQTNCDTHEINNLLSQKGFNAELINIFCCLVDKRRSLLLLSMLLQHNSSFGETVVTIDWLVKLVYGTSALKNIKYPLLQLALTTINSKQTKKYRSYDITKDMLGKIITILEHLE